MPKIFLSAVHLQPYNEYYGSGNEQEYMNKLANEHYLTCVPTAFNIPEGKIGTNVGQSIRDSNAGYYDLHLALHSNPAPKSMAGKSAGRDVYYYANSPFGKNAAEIIADNFKEIYPNPNLVKAGSTTTLRK